MLFNVYDVGLGVFQHLFDVVRAMCCKQFEWELSNGGEDINRLEAVPCPVAAGAASLI